MNIVTEKRCTKCGEIKPIDKFPIQAKHKDGHSSWCHACHVVAAMKWQKANPDRARENAEKRRKNHPDGVSAKRRAQSREQYLKNKDAINERDRAKSFLDGTRKKMHVLITKDVEQEKGYCAMCGEVDIVMTKLGWRCAISRLQSRGGVLKRQHGTCLICWRQTKLVYDHDHVTGKFRGWICAKCNTGLGMFMDDVDSLANAIAYLKYKR